MARRINLLYMLPCFGTGGTERLVSELSTLLDRNRFNVSACVLQNGVVGEALACRGYRVHVLNSRADAQRTSGADKFRALSERVARLHTIVARDQIDILHTHHLGPLLHGLLARVRSRRWRWIHTEHNRPDVNVQQPRWLVRLGRCMFLFPDFVTGVSDAVGAYFVEAIGIPARRVRVIYNGIDVERFAARYDGASKRLELGIPPEAWVIGLVGNLRPEKNQDLLLRAFAGVLQVAPDAWLVLVGDGERRGQLEVLAGKLRVQHRVCFLGSRLDVPELFAVFDVYCLPSLYEGMPLTVLEAMAAMKPIVATRVEGIRELISDGRTGLLVPPDDPVALARALLHLRQDPALAEKLVEGGRHYVAEYGRLEEMVKQYDTLYTQVMNA